MTQDRYRKDEWWLVMGSYPPCFAAEKNKDKCRGKATEAAHMIAATYFNIKIYGFFVIHCHLNMKPSCKPCNDYAMHFSSRQGKVDHILRIWKYLDSKGLPYNKVDLNNVLF